MVYTPDDELRIPEGGLTFDPPMRMHHLTGGLSILMSFNRLASLLSPRSQTMVFFSVLRNASLDASLKAQEGIRILGRNHFSVAEEMNDPVTSNFAVSANAPDNRCLAYVQNEKWAGLAVALHRMERDSEALLVNRVVSQMRLCLSRLERLSLAYRTVLSSTDIEPASSSGISFTSDKYAQFLGSEYRSVLNELYSLRDALLAAAYRLRYKHSDPFTMKKMRQTVLSEPGDAAKLIVSSMFSEEGDLLIDHMSLYRSVAQHCLGATNPVLGDVYQLKISQGPFGELPYLIYPLYDDIGKMRDIEQGSSKGVLEKLPIEEAKRFMGIGEYRDALEFCYDCFVRLLKIAELLHQEVGIAPEVTIITDDDIIELTVTDETGKVVRAKRDEATGRLVEY